MNCAAAEWDFETSRLRIRPLQPGDERLYCDLYSDPETMRFIGTPLSPSRAARSFRRLLAASEQHSRGLVLAIVERSSGAAVGLCSVQNIDTGMRSAEAGIILHARARSNGYSREGLGALVDRAFERLGLDEVWVRISADYAVVRRLVMSVGFSKSPPRADNVRGLEIWRIRRMHGSAS